MTRSSTSEPAVYDKCNGHAVSVPNAPPHLPNGSVLTSKEETSTYVPTQNGSAHRLLENGSAYPVKKSENSQQTILGNGSTLTVLENGSAHLILQNGSDKDLNGGDSVQLQWKTYFEEPSENIRLHQNEDERGKNNTAHESAEDGGIHIRNALNAENENESEILRDMVSTLESVSIQDPGSQSNAGYDITENDAVHTKLFPNQTPNESQRQTETMSSLQRGTIQEPYDKTSNDITEGNANEMRSFWNVENDESYSLTDSMYTRESAIGETVQTSATNDPMDYDEIHTENPSNSYSVNETEGNIDARFLETGTVQESDEYDSTDRTLTDNDGTETESDFYSDASINESASLYVSQEDEIELLPSESYSGDKTHEIRDRGDNELACGFPFDEDWEDRFSDYPAIYGDKYDKETDDLETGEECFEVTEKTNLDTLPKDVMNESISNGKEIEQSEEKGEEESKEVTESTNLRTLHRDSVYQIALSRGDKERENSEEGEETNHVPGSTNLGTLHRDSDYQSTFNRSVNMTLECPQVLASERSVDEEFPSVLPELSVIPRKPSWEDQDDTGPRLTSTLFINRQDNLEKDAQVPDISIGETEDVTSSTDQQLSPDDEDDSPIATSERTSCTEPPQVVCELTPDDEESEEESSREEDTEKLKPEPRRRRRPIEEEEKKDEDDDDEESPRQRLRRCSSLKTGKTPPGTPHRKKIVRFADVLGLDLADVRTFMDEIPRIPSSAYDDLRDADLSLGSLANPVVASATPVNPVFSAVAGPDPSSNLTLSMCTPCKTLMPTFQQPGGQTDFLERIRTRFVCLENAVVNDVATSSIAGMVRVRNVDFHKSVYVRYSIDGWKTYSDLQATYVPNSCDGFSDKFSFVLFAHTLSIGQKLEFAIRFQCKGTQYWDNNGGANYGFQCLPASSSSPYMNLPSPDDRWGSFY